MTNFELQFIQAVNPNTSQSTLTVLANDVDFRIRKWVTYHQKTESSEKRA